MSEIEKRVEVKKTERERIREELRQKKEKQRIEQSGKIITECPECRSRSIIKDYQRAERVCSECGLVIESSIVDPGPEWRAFDSKQHNQRARTGHPMTPTIYDKGLSTFIGSGDRDFHGRTISPKTRAKFRTMRKWHRRVVYGKGTRRSLILALSEIDRMASALGLSKNINESAAIIYRKAMEKNLVRGRFVEVIASAALYAACRQFKFPRTLDEIANVSRARRKEIGRTFKLLSTEIDLKLAPISPIEYLPRFCSALGLGAEVESKAREILLQIGDNGRSPPALAAAAIYKALILYCGRKINQEKLANIAGITTVTLRNIIRSWKEIGL